MSHRPCAPIGALLLLSALSLPSVALADRPEGTYFAFIQAPYEIYRLARVEPDQIADMTCATLTSGINGRYKSKCTLASKLDGTKFETDGKIQYKTYNEDGKTKVKLKGAFKGDVKIDGEKFDVTETLKGKGKVVPGQDFVDMVWTLKVCLENSVRDCAKTDIPVNVPLATDDGRWTLTLNILPPQEGKLGKKLEGTATLAFQDGMTHEYALTGKWDPQEDVSTIEFEATDPAKGGELMIKKARASSGSLSMEGKLLYDLYGHDGKLKAFFNQMSVPTGN